MNKTIQNCIFFAVQYLVCKYLHSISIKNAKLIHFPFNIIISLIKCLSSTFKYTQYIPFQLQDPLSSSYLGFEFPLGINKAHIYIDQSEWSLRHYSLRWSLPPRRPSGRWLCRRTPASRCLRSSSLTCPSAPACRRG